MSTESSTEIATAFLVVASSSSWCDIHPLSREQPTTIGRDGKNTITLKCDRCSRYHCEIFSKDDGWVVSDLHSRNGTFINGERVVSTRPLAPGDQLKVGTVEYRLTNSLDHIDGEGASIEDMTGTDSETRFLLGETQLPLPRKAH